MSPSAPFDPEKLITVLARHRVKFVLIGAVAARLYGFPRLTADADITPSRDEKNLVRLAASLSELQARVFTESIPEGLPFACDPATLSRAAMWNLVTTAGRLDITFTPSGTEGYQDLARSAERFEVFGATLLVASLEDIIRSKEAAGRPQDRLDAAVMREMLKRRRRGRGR